tara:strand:+ start:633 stop:1025 length:393 start_codon:yes stop_codon:yes gene_type:complete
MKTLFLIRGVSGSGKTTLSHHLKTENDKIISTDDFFVDSNGDYNFDVLKLKENHLKCQQQVGKWMVEGYDIFVHNTFTQDWEMKPYFILGETFGYKVFTLVVENRHKSESVHNVPSETLDGQRERFEVVL